MIEQGQAAPGGWSIRHRLLAIALLLCATLPGYAIIMLIKPVLPESVIEWIERVTQEQRAPVEAQNA